MDSKTKINDILDQIDEVLCEDHAAARKLWSILTALRGPDDGNDELKTRTTAIIRAKAFPKFADVYDLDVILRKKFNHMGVEVNPDKADWDKQFDQASGKHFRQHAEYAMCALSFLRRWT